MENKTITAKDVYLFAMYCLEVQQDNEKTLTSLLKLNTKRKEIKRELAATLEKQDFLKNTLSIVEALYEKTGQALSITDEDKEQFKKDYIERGEE